MLASTEQTVNHMTKLLYANMNEFLFEYIKKSILIFPIRDETCGFFCHTIWNFRSSLIISQAACMFYRKKISYKNTREINLSQEFICDRKKIKLIIWQD